MSVVPENLLFPNPLLPKTSVSAKKLVKALYNYFSSPLKVWFQNKRSKERRMKQMNGRGKFFLGGPKMRKFGLDDARFYFYDGGAAGPRPDFGPYGPPPPFADFYGPGPPPPGPPPPPPGAFGGPLTSMEQPVPMSLPPPANPSTGSGNSPSDADFSTIPGSEF